MHTLLRPFPDTPYLSVAEVVSRLAASFPVVDVDQREGLLFVSERMLRNRPGATHAELESAIALLSEAVLAIVADDPQSDEYFVRAFVIPNESIVVDWVDSEHARRCQQLLQRFAATLDYQIVESSEA